MAKSRVYVKYVRNLTKTEFDTLYCMNMGVSGCMRGRLCTSYYDKEDNAQAILIRQDGEILAWAYVFEGDHSDSKAVYFWVEPKHRRKGLGARLMRHVKKIEREPYVFPWDKRSGRFFGNFRDSIQVSEWDEDLLDA